MNIHVKNSIKGTITAIPPAIPHTASEVCCVIELPLDPSSAPRLLQLPGGGVAHVDPLPSYRRCYSSGRTAAGTPTVIYSEPPYAAKIFTKVSASPELLASAVRAHLSEIVFSKPPHSKCTRHFRETFSLRLRLPSSRFAVALLPALQNRFFSLHWYRHVTENIGYYLGNQSNDNSTLTADGTPAQIHEAFVTLMRALEKARADLKLFTSASLRITAPSAETLARLLISTKTIGFNVASNVAFVLRPVDELSTTLAALAAPRSPDDAMIRLDSVVGVITNLTHAPPWGEL